MDHETANEAHPAFVEILKQLTPDEGQILKFMPFSIRAEVLMNLSYTYTNAGAEFLVVRNVSTLGEDALCEYPILVPKYIDNLCRLGLTQIPPGRHLSEASRYERLLNLELVKTVRGKVPELAKFTPLKKMIEITSLGESFRFACMGADRSNEYPRPY